MMRIVIATKYRGVVGGVETYLQDLLIALRERGHPVALLYEDPVVGMAAIDGDGTGGPAWKVAEKALPELLREIAAWRPDIVFNHGVSDLDLEQALQAVFPTALFGQGYFGTCVSETKCFSFPGVQPCSRVLGLACLGLYLPRRCGGLSPVTMLRQYAHQRRRQRLLSGYRAVVVASRHMFTEYANAGVSADRLHLAPLFAPGIVPDPQPPEDRPRTNRVLFIGRLVRLKGGEFLVRALVKAAKELGQPLTLVAAGEGADREKMALLAEQFGLAAEFPGWQNRARCVELMRGCDLLAVPSLWPEPFGLVGLEGGCVGLPAAAYEVGGIPDWLRPGESGELAPGNPPTVDGLAAAIVRALADPQHRQRLAHGAWTVAQQFTRERHCELLEDYLERAIGRVPVQGA